MKKNLLQFFVSAFLYFCATLTATTALLTPAHAMLRIEVCGGATDTNTCKAGVDSISTTGGEGKVVIGCAAGDPTCTVNDQEIKVNAKSPLPTPPGWTPAVLPSIDPTPPSTYQSPTLPSANVPTTTVANWDAAMGGAQCVVYFNTATSNTYFMMAPSAAGCPGVATSGYTGASLQNPPRYLFQLSPWGPFVPGYNCPNYSGATRAACTLQNAALVPKPSDNKCTIKRIGNTFSGDTLDPDCSVQPNVSVTGSSVTITPVSGSVESGKIEFQPDGSGAIEMNTPNSDGTTTKKRVTFGTPDGTTGDSVVTGTSTATYKGTGTEQGTTPLGELPTDYNRETTQQQIKSGIDDLNTKLDGTGVDTTLDGAILFLIQHPESLDKQVRQDLMEYLVKCRRFDKIKLPIISALGEFLTFGMWDGFLPKIHLGVVTYPEGGSPQSPLVVDRWFYRAHHLYAAYDTEQVFSDKYDKGLFSYLTPWHLKGRYESPTPFELIASWLRGELPEQRRQRPPERPAARLSPLMALSPNRRWVVTRQLVASGAL